MIIKRKLWSRRRKGKAHSRTNFNHFSGFVDLNDVAYPNHDLVKDFAEEAKYKFPTDMKKAEEEVSESIMKNQSVHEDLKGVMIGAALEKLRTI